MKAISFLICLILFWCAPANADDEKAFRWIAINNNRLLTDDAGQDKFEKQLCRALDCSRAPTLKPSFWFCARFFASSKYKTTGIGAGSFPKSEERSESASFCSKEGFRRTTDGDYWEPFPDGVNTHWDAQAVRYGKGVDYVRSRARTIRAWTDASEFPQGSSCQWMLESVDADWITKPCDSADPSELYHAELALDTTYQLKMRLQPDATVYTREVRVEDVLVAVLGDSYASGEGNPHTFRKEHRNREFRKLDTWLDRQCHRSLISFPSMAVAIAAILDRQQGTRLKHTFTSLNFSCSGAEIYGEDDDGGGLLKPYVGREAPWQMSILGRLYPDPVPHNAKKLRSQIDQLKGSLCAGSFPCEGYRAPDYLIISTGGNDVGFGNIIREAINKCRTIKSQCALNLVEQRLATLRKSFKDLVTAVAELGPKKIFLTEYPDLTHSESGAFCDDFDMRKTLGPRSLGQMDYWIDIPLSWGGIGVSRHEAEEAYRTVLAPLNRFLQEIANENGWTMVSGAEHQSGFRGWCAKPSWFVRWIDSALKQGMLPEVKDRSELSDQLTTGIAHPNIFGHNWLNWQIRCQFEKDGILPPGSTQAGGKGTAAACGAVVSNQSR